MRDVHKHGQYLSDWQAFAANQFQIGFASAETARSADFIKIVLSAGPFRANIIQVTVDESHAISEWGTEIFCPDYGKLGELRTRLPSGIPWQLPSATLPTEYIDDMIQRVGLNSDTVRIELSNAKPNIALSVRTLQCPKDSYLDLIPLIPLDTTEPGDIPQTLVYSNFRIEVEDMQDVIRAHIERKYPTIPPECVKFYHRHIGSDRKKIIEDKIHYGSLRVVFTTDALGWVNISHQSKIQLS